MRKLLILFALSFLAAILTGCSEGRKEKPFIVVDKEYYITRGERLYYYTLEDDRGQIWTITERESAYKLGDTIK